MHALVSIPLLISRNLSPHHYTLSYSLHLTLSPSHSFWSPTPYRPHVSPAPLYLLHLPPGHLSCRTNSAVIDSTLSALVIPPHFYLLNHLPGPHHLTSTAFFLFSTPSSFSHYPTPLLSPAPILTISQPSYLLQLTPFDTALRLHLSHISDHPRH